ncbi:gliding motility-associated C-terminal domain-containing protein [Fibrella sp. HMF5335]|uniref:Gliding motility-associated C-terminal domain-containing protein n=1 Tax=Fibrella rubiginis TaxID=2817060 RepID=A0A939GC45_9BACT|nr:gliding motility-associated C-terminal domain-containing protein [Fibrella rubiginis]MBO0936199.1 gliding motility-associated C-terminal domain-containing protein [Fibrella rubiginis]
MKSALLFLFLLCQSAQLAWASHIAGGNVELVATGKPGQYRLSLNLYIDEASKGPEAIIDPQIYLSIFRQRDNKLMGDFPLKFLRKILLVYANPACARSKGLETSEVKYQGLVQLDAAQYADQAGYYIVWEKCCRNKNVTNIDRPDQAGMIYYLAFPALQRNGGAFRNSSPVFLTPNPEYICRDKDFTLPFQATDADGDELRYSLVTPYRDNIYTPFGFKNSYKDPDFPLLRWQSGYSAQQAITGKPALSISPDGVLRVKPDKLGLFAFAVLCEEYRNGVKIGEVRRDHQILVVDCSPQVPPKPTITAVSPTGASPVAICVGSDITLTSENAADFNYQWRRDGYNLPGENKPTIRTTLAGDYTVIKSFATVCTRDSVSEPFRVTYKPNDPARITAADTVICVDRPATLQANARPDFRYQWYQDGKPLPGETKDRLVSPRGGKYRLEILNTTNGCLSADSINLVKSPLTSVSVVAALAGPLCAGGQLTVRLPQSLTGISYSWQLNGSPLSTTSVTTRADKPGAYLVTVSDTACSVKSALAQVNARPVPLIDSISPICGASAPTLTLQANPAGGVFSGTGITGGRLNPGLIGAGRHTVMYSVTNTAGCRADTTRTFTVVDVPQPDLGADMTIVVGSRVNLGGPPGAGLTYAWTPLSGLTSATAVSITAQPAQTTTYKLTVSRNGVCPLTDEVVLTVLPGLFIPTAFSPNGDSLNDSWEFRGIESFPGCAVRVFNRWGEVIFASDDYQHPWDGRRDGQLIPSGVYHYVVKPTPYLAEERGTLVVMY